MGIPNFDFQSELLRQTILVLLNHNSRFCPSGFLFTLPNFLGDISGNETKALLLPCYCHNIFNQLSIFRSELLPWNTGAPISISIRFLLSPSPCDSYKGRIWQPRRPRPPQSRLGVKLNCSSCFLELPFIALETLTRTSRPSLP